MVFSSLVFLFVYLPAVLLTYYISPAKWRNIVLFLVNMIFYGWGEPVYLLLMMLSIVVDYLLGIGIGKYREKRRVATGMLVASVVWNIGLLFFFKYFDFLLQSLQSVGILRGISPLGFPLPIGISFYTFQKLSYTIDVYRGECKEQKNFIDFSVFVTLFPQLIAGPILQYKDLAEQLSKRVLSMGKMREGIRIFTIGLCKKVLLANSVGKLWDDYRVLEITELSTAGAWIGLLAFCFQIYFDFSGYSDMAIGLGKMLGFDFNINFNYPYISKSVTEFWRRWHISLSSWFRDYLYIPLGGNRKGKTRWMLNILIVWAATGIWHGASFNFLLWGLYYAVLLMIEKLWLLKKLEKLPVFLGHIYALFFIVLGWGIFAIPDATAGIKYLGALFGTTGVIIEPGDIFQMLNYMVLLIALIFASVPLGRQLFHKMPAKAQSVTETVLIMGGLLLSTAYLVDSTYNPFLYFRF
ncbi:MAG: MBOAT family protein [Lachnospiraceae bacterium]|nr:MBOAT family protein [Lachnospiraceae bacterium]